MYKLCKTEQSNKRQREIEEVFLNLMLEKHYDDITVSEICDKMNLPRKSFYRYFDGKEGVKQAILYHTFSDFNIFYITNNSDKSKLYEEFETLFYFWKGRRKFLEAFDKSGLLGLVVESAVTFSMKDFNGIQKYMLDANSSSQVFAFQFAVCGLMTMTVNWYRSGFVETVPNLAKAATQIITRPIFENLSRTE